MQQTSVARVFLVPWAVLLVSSVLAAEAVMMRGSTPNIGKHINQVKAPFKQQCSSRRKALVQLAASGAKTNLTGLFTGEVKSPDTGMDTEKVQTQLDAGVSYKDGYFNVDCIKDYMYYKGDKFGDHKYDYELEKTAQVSIVFPLSYVPKEDRKLMTVDYCYGFCRQLKQMVFFGIVNGRDCYCTPYIKPMAGDDSTCTATCDGDKGAICGSKTKSMVYQMHSCDDTLIQLDKSLEALGVLVTKVGDLAASMGSIGVKVDAKADEMKAKFGAIGDPAASNLFQESEKVGSEMNAWSGKLSALKTTMEGTETATEAILVKDFSIIANAKEADSLMATMAQEATLASKSLEEATEYTLSVTPTNDLFGKTLSDDAADQYYPIMYFVDKKLNATPATCSGQLMKTHIGVSKGGCAAMCDAAGSKGCMGFLFVPGKDAWHRSMPSSVCFTFSGLTSIQYYTKTDCATASEVMCYGKLSKLLDAPPLDKEKGQKAVKAERCMPVPES
mmetsp:Transcript_68150/g.121475  ORF Transcript_68150/g.121475 Transcript_68150/m.121475 type:complete len:501 (+) Transcript_68150:36-1538(+)